MLTRLLFCLLLLLPAPVWSAFDMDGNDHIDAANDAVTEADLSTFSWSCWVKVTTAGASLPEQFITHAAALSGGNFRMALSAIVPSSTGWRFDFTEGFSGAAFSEWRVNADMSTGTWYHVGVDYDSTAANDPVLYVNGVSVASSEIVTPSGTRLTGSDSLRIGEDLGGTSDVLGSMAECAMWNRRLTSGEWSNLGVDKWAPSKIPSGLIYYIPLITSAVDAQGATGTLTVTGGTWGTHPPGIVYPATGRRAVAPMLLP